jgi:hypothetical protein
MIVPLSFQNPIYVSSKPYHHLKMAASLHLRPGRTVGFIGRLTVKKNYEM